MRLPVQITFHAMDRSDAVEAAAREKAGHLERFYTDITSCRVAVDLLQKHHQQGRPFGVRIDLTLPGRELVVNRVENEDVYVAVRDAFDAMKRQLEDAVRQRRGQQKHHSRELHGEVARFEQVRIGSAVQFIVEVAAQGLQAKRVSLGKRHGG